MRPPFRRSFLCAVALALPAVAAADGETIAFFTKNQTNPFFQAVRLGADAAARQYNAKVVHYVPTKPDSIPEQLSQVEDVIVKKPDAIVFVPVDYKALVPSKRLTRPASRLRTLLTGSPPAISWPMSAQTTTTSRCSPGALCSRRSAARAMW